MKYVYIIKHIAKNDILYVANASENKEPYNGNPWRTLNIKYSATFMFLEEALKRKQKLNHGTFVIEKINLEDYLHLL